MAPFQYDATGIELIKYGGTLVPDAWYDFRVSAVKETKSGKGDFQVWVTCQIINHPDLSGKSIDHCVTFMPPEAKGAGMAMGFLKAIGEPWEGKIDVEPGDWLGCVFRARTQVETYKNKRGDNTQRSKLAEIEASVPAEQAPVRHNEDWPFEGK